MASPLDSILGNVLGSLGGTVPADHRVAGALDAHAKSAAA